MIPATPCLTSQPVCLSYAIGMSSMGFVLVAVHGVAVQAVLMGDDAEVLVRDLQARFPRQRLVLADEQSSAYLSQLIGYIESPSGVLDLPSVVQGTDFQQRVWQAIRQIPLGATMSYSALAQRIGAPRSVRALASACAANPLALLVPCHRVVRQDGGLSGYRWGVTRKKMLLEREQKNSQQAS